MMLAERERIFKDWLSEHKALIFKVVRAYAFTAIDRDDLFQEITMQVWHSIPTFRQEAAVSTWMYRIALNTAIKWTKKERKHNHAATPENVQQLLVENIHAPDERLVWLYEEIHHLDPIDRSLTLLLLDNFSYKEMAVMLGISESNVGVKINRIKKQLITKIKKKDDHGI
ncbi:MAG: RNA polymerase sigma factor [Ferruginibacter sp.]